MPNPAAGIDYVLIKNRCREPSTWPTHLLRWLLDYTTQMRFGFENKIYALADKWAVDPRLDSLGAQLVTLHIMERSNIWPVLFKLHKLGELRLRVLGSRSPQLPASRQLSCLRNLELTECSADLSPLLIGASLPNLKFLILDRCAPPKGHSLNVDWNMLTGLEGLSIKACKPLLIEVRLDPFKRL
jgi:hypothetical protein